MIPSKTMIRNPSNQTRKEKPNGSRTYRKDCARYHSVRTRYDLHSQSFRSHKVPRPVRAYRVNPIVCCHGNAEEERVRIGLPVVGIARVGVLPWQQISNSEE